MRRNSAFHKVYPKFVDPNNKNTQGLSEAFFKNKVKIYGITNGIDFENYNPTDINKSHLPYSYILL